MIRNLSCQLKVCEEQRASRSYFRDQIVKGRVQAHPPFQHSQGLNISQEKLETCIFCVQFTFLWYVGSEFFLNSIQAKENTRTSQHFLCFGSEQYLPSSVNLSIHCKENPHRTPHGVPGITLGPGDTGIMETQHLPSIRTAQGVLNQ